MSYPAKYGYAPERVGIIQPDFTEFMRWLYLPVKIDDQSAIPPNLVFLNEMLALAEAGERGRGNKWRYTYISATRGYATPGNPLNRPGWHSDGFGSQDVNYVWTDAFPTLFAVQQFEGISDDHLLSAQQFEEQVKPETIRTYPDCMLLRLDPSMIHAAPEIPEPGGMRSFVKISFSDSRYNLLGNSHNHGLNYSWKMWNRAELRNDPAFAGKDSGPQ